MNEFIKDKQITPVFLSYAGAWFCIFIAFCTNVTAQTITASLNLAKKEPRPLWFEYCKADAGLVTLSHLTKTSSRYVGIFKYDDEFKREWGKQLFENSVYKNIENLSVLNDKIIVFMNDYYPREKSYVYYRYEYDLDGNRTAKDTLIQKFDKAPDNKRYFRYVKSLNKKKLLAFQVKEEGGVDFLNYYVFDVSESGFKSGKLKFPYPSENLLIKEVKIGVGGNLFVLARHYKSGKVRSPNDYRFLLFKYDITSGETVEYPIESSEKFITDITIKPDKDENVLIGGFYSLKSERQIIGACAARVLAESETLLPIQFSKFDEKLLVNYLTPRQIEKGRELADFYLDDLVLRSDGGLLLLAEQYYETSTLYRDVYGFMESRSLYHYDDVLIVSLSPESEIEWTSVVTKNQASESQFEISYLSLIGAERLLLFYKTRLKGLGANIYYSKVNYEGVIENPRAFFDDFSNSDVFYREACEQISNSEAILVYYQGRKKLFSLVKISF